MASENPCTQWIILTSASTVAFSLKFFSKILLCFISAVFSVLQTEFSCSTSCFRICVFFSVRSLIFVYITAPYSDTACPIPSEAGPFSQKKAFGVTGFSSNALWCFTASYWGTKLPSLHNTWIPPTDCSCSVMLVSKLHDAFLLFLNKTERQEDSKTALLYLIGRTHFSSNC